MGSALALSEFLFSFWRFVYDFHLQLWFLFWLLLVFLRLLASEAYALPNSESHGGLAAFTGPEVDKKIQTS